jgi:hypothetical protein
MKGLTPSRFLKFMMVFLVSLILSQTGYLGTIYSQRMSQPDFPEEINHSPMTRTLLPPGSYLDASLDLAFAEALKPPKNPFLADSPWPIYHQNNYAQASTLLRGLEAGDDVEVDVLRTNLSGASPWTQLSEAYPNGERIAWGSTATHVFKASFVGDTFELIDSYRIDFNPFNVHWSIFLLEGNRAIVPDPAKRRFYRFTDADPTNPASSIVLEDTFIIPDSVPGNSAHTSVAYDGWIIFTTSENYIGAISPDFQEFRSLQLPAIAGEVNYHNGFSLDEQGGIYLVTTERMLRVDWQDTQFSIGWDAPYNFRGPGCEDRRPARPIQEFLEFLRGGACTGSGTTPTLMGLEGQDQLVLVADGHTPNNMVAFWRDEIPPDWVGLPGYDRRVAAVTPLPYSTPEGPGFTAENSPTAWGYDIAIAQYNGFTPGPNPLPGVQKLTWNPDARTLDLAWATDAVNFNNVMTYSVGSNLVYGTGQREAVFYFWGLDWDTGAVALEIPLGQGNDFLDQGNQITIAEDRTVLYASATGIVRLRPTALSSLDEDENSWLVAEFKDGLGDSSGPAPPEVLPGAWALEPLGAEVLADWPTLINPLPQLFPGFPADGLSPGAGGGELGDGSHSTGWGDELSLGGIVATV